MSALTELVNALAREQPELIRLAEAVSLAVRVDPPLLRKARLDFVPDADAGTEAELWRSPLVKTRSPEGFVFLPEAAEALRSRLAGDPRRLEDCRKMTEALHRHLPPAVQLEEEIAWLSVVKTPEAAVRIEELLRSALAALVVDERRGLASWAARALPSLPSSVRASATASMLHAGAQLRLGRGADFLRGDAEMPEWAPWVAPPDLPRVPVAVRLFPGQVELDARSPDSGLRLDLPATDPLLVDLSWVGGGAQVTFRQGEVQRIDVSAQDVRLRTVLGEVYHLRKREEIRTGAPRDPKYPDFDYDYIVIGSGAGGGPVAVRLAEAGFTVCLIEAGQAPEQDWYNVPVFHALASEHPDISWQFFPKHYDDEIRSQRDKKYLIDKGGVFYPRAGTLGGCTQHHGMITVYPHNSDWQNIADLTGDSSWAPDKMRAYFERLERCTYVKDPGQGKPNPTRHGYKGWLTTTDLDLTLGLGDPAVVQTVLKAIKAAWLEGFSGSLPDLPQDPNDWRTPKFEGIAFAPLSTIEGRRAGTRELINRTRATFPQRLILRQSNLAARILFDANKRAIGVECWEGKHLYRADPNASIAEPYEVKKYYCSREVILAGGAFNSPQLLMLSGIGPAEHLQQFGIPVLVDRPGVGTNLQDRYEVSVVSEMKQNWKTIKGATFEPPLPNQTGDPCYVDWQKGKGVYTTNGALLAVIKKSSPDRPDPDLFMYALAGNFQGYFPGYSHQVERTKNFLTWLVLKAHTENRAGFVRLRSSDPRDRPEINFRYFDEPITAQRDIDAVLEGVRFVRKISKHNTAIKQETIPGPDIATDDQIRDFIKDNAWGHHASCSNRMGKPSDPAAVVDSNFRVIGVENLRVVDASVFPRIPGFFIVTPIYMIAEKAADVILADAKKTPAAKVA